jgi:carbon monoxide dehydrogenase subunit G
MQTLLMPLYAALPLGRSFRHRFGHEARLMGAWLLLLFTPHLAAATVVDVQTFRNGNLIEVRAQATIDAPLATVWGTLTDYEHLPEFIPGLKKSRVIARNGSTATIEQSGEARFLFFTIPIEVTLESTERPPLMIEVRRVAGSLRQLQGRYETEVITVTNQVQLRWAGAVEPESDLPPLIGEALMRQSIKAQFVGMVREIEKREAARQQALQLQPQPQTTP